MDFYRLIPSRLAIIRVLGYCSVLLSICLSLLASEKNPLLNRAFEMVLYLFIYYSFWRYLLNFNDVFTFLMGIILCLEYKLPLKAHFQILQCTITIPLLHSLSRRQFDYCFFLDSRSMFENFHNLSNLFGVFQPKLVVK